MENNNSSNIEAKQAQEALGKIAETVEEKAKSSLDNNFGWRGATSSSFYTNDKGEVEVITTHNHANTNLNKTAESVVHTATKATVSESEAARGYSEVSKIKALYGIGNATHEVLKASAAESLYNGRGVADNYSMAQKTFGQEYRIGTNASGNVFKDYQSNMKAVSAYLTRQNIFVNSMTKKQAEDLARKIGNDPGSNEIKFALEEFVRLKELEPRMNQLARHQGGIINTGKAWISESIKDTDFNKGYNVAKTSYVVGKAAMWATKGTVAGIATAPVKSIELSQKVNATVNNVRTFHHKATSENMKVGSEKWKAELKATKNNIKFEHSEIRKIQGEKITEIHNAVKSPVKYSTGKLLKSKPVTAVKGKISSKIGGTPLGKTLGKLRETFIATKKRTMFIRATIRKKTAVFRILPNAFGKLSLLAKKAVIAVGLGLLVLAVFCIIMISALGAIIPDGSVQRDDTNSYASGVQNSQSAIDTVYGEYQLAYEDNIVFCNPGSEFALKGLPSTWTLNDATDTVNQEPSAIMGRGAESCNNRGIEGYDLSKYWGAKICEYTATVKDYTGTYDSNGNAIYNDATITLIGTGGLEGDAGSYTTLYAYIPEDTEAYRNRNSKINEDVSIEIGYKGSQYCEYEYKNQYIAEDYSKFIVGGYYDGVLESVGMGLETGEEVRYSANNMYKAFLGMAHGFTENEDENEGFYTDYVKHLFKLITDEIQYGENLFLITQFITDTSQEITFTYTDPDGGGAQLCTAYGYKAEVTVLLTYVKSGIQDIMRLEPPTAEMNTWAHSNVEHPSTGAYRIIGERDSDYRYWDGWWHADGTMTDEHMIAVDNYEYLEEDWVDGFDTVIFPESWGSTLSDPDIEDILEQILEEEGEDGLTQERLDFIRFALSCIGKFYYLYGGGHGNLDNVQVGDGLDCSGYVSYCLYKCGLMSSSTGKSCSALLGQYSRSNFNGDFRSLTPGDLIVKNSSAGSTSSSSNHIVIYIGYAQLSGDSEPRPYCVECTTYNGVSGVQLSAPGRISRISTYNYVLNPFS